MKFAAWLSGLALLASGWVQAAPAEDVPPGVPFKEGDTISFDQIDKLKSYLPEAFWENREYLFYEGMQMSIGPAYRESV